MASLALALFFRREKCVSDKKLMKNDAVNPERPPPPNVQDVENLISGLCGCIDSDCDAGFVQYDYSSS